VGFAIIPDDGLTMYVGVKTWAARNSRFQWGHHGPVEGDRISFFTNERSMGGVGRGSICGGN